MYLRAVSDINKSLFKIGVVFKFIHVISQHFMAVHVLVLKKRIKIVISPMYIACL